METTIQKWGNSLAVRLPRDLARKLKLREGSQVLVTQDRRRRIVIKRTPQKGAALSTLISKISRTNTHDEVVWGTPRGKEVW